jgi:hypothetical protein
MTETDYALNIRTLTFETEAAHQCNCNKGSSIDYASIMKFQGGAEQQLLVYLIEDKRKRNVDATITLVIIHTQTNYHTP